MNPGGGGIQCTINDNTVYKGGALDSLGPAIDCDSGLEDRAGSGSR